MSAQMSHGTPPAARVTWEMSGMDMIMAMSEGNPGAITVLMSVMKDGASIDPDDLRGGMLAILMMDTLGCYGSSIWVLYKDVCGASLNKLIAVLRAFQLGLISKEIIDRAIKGDRGALNVEEALRKVKERLPAFVVEEGV